MEHPDNSLAFLTWLVSASDFAPFFSIKLNGGRVSDKNKKFGKTLFVYFCVNNLGIYFSRKKMGVIYQYE